jgi:hypothetical protein
MRKIVSIASLCLLIFAGCEKNKLPVPLDFNIPAKLKINYASAYAGNPAVQLKINDQRVSDAFKYAYPYPGGGLNTQGGSQPDYFSVPTGSVKVSLSIPKVGTNTDSVLLYTTTVNIDGNNYYTLHIADTAANTQSVLLKENTASPDSGFSTYRFVNLIPNQAVDLYFNNVVVASNIPYKGASNYFNIAFPTASTWAVRPAGAASNTTAIASYNNTSSNQRVFTVYARGYAGASDANRKPNVSLYYVR